MNEVSDKKLAQLNTLMELTAGRMLGLNRAELEKLKLSAILHDIGSCLL